MARNTPGKHYRHGLSLVEIVRMFPVDETASGWIERVVWPDYSTCPHCGTTNVQSGIKHRSMTHRCRECEGYPRFSAKTGTVMHSSKLGYQKWAIAAYLVTTNLKGVSSMKLHRDLDITQKSARYMLHRLRTAYDPGVPIFAGPVEVDETYVGGLCRTPDVESMYRRYLGHLEGREPLPAMAYFCLTVLEWRGGSRPKAAERFGISEQVLCKVGNLSSRKGGPVARKADAGGSPNAPE